VWDNDTTARAFLVCQYGCRDRTNPSIVLGRHIYDDAQTIKDPRPDTYQGATYSTVTSSATMTTTPNYVYQASGVGIVLTVPPSASLTSNWIAYVQNTYASGTVNVLCQGSDAINSASSLSVPYTRYNPSPVRLAQSGVFLFTQA
jgi:hypothetical protein